MGTTQPDLYTTAAGIADWLNGVKHPRKIDSFSDEMIERYGHGMRLRDMQSDWEKRYAVEDSTGCIRTRTDPVWDDMRAWQQRAWSERDASVFRRTGHQLASEWYAC